MPALHQKTIIYVMILPFCMVATAIQLGQGEFPVGISPLTIPSTIGECPADDSRQDSRNLLRNATRHVIYNAARTPNPIQLQICGPGSWRRVFHLNATASDQSCPGDWNLVTSPVRGCGGAGDSCRSAFSDVITTAYSKVCGRIVGEGVGHRNPDGFYRTPQVLDRTIGGNYLDGVSITRGVPGSRTHIWSFAAGHAGRCPCDNTNRGTAPLPPAEVGQNYFCDRADGLDSLWTGEGCTNDNPCCSFHNPPYFSVQLPSATTDSIELRICTDEPEGNEPVLVLSAEIYVQ